jgi:hypothetical protein
MGKGKSMKAVYGKHCPSKGLEEKREELIR